MTILFYIHETKTWTNNERSQNLKKQQKKITIFNTYNFIQFCLVITVTGLNKFSGLGSGLLVQLDEI